MLTITKKRKIFIHNPVKLTAHKKVYFLYNGHFLNSKFNLKPENLKCLNMASYFRKITRFHVPGPSYKDKVDLQCMDS